MMMKMGNGYKVASDTFCKKDQSWYTKLIIFPGCYICLACHCNDLHHLISVRKERERKVCDPNRITNKSTNWIGWWDERFKKEGNWQHDATTWSALRWSLFLSVYFCNHQTKLIQKEEKKLQCWVLQNQMIIIRSREKIVK